MSSVTSAVPVRSRPAPERREHLRVAPAVSRRRARARLTAFGIALVTVGSIFMIVTFHVIAAQSAFRMDQLSKQLTNEQYRYERLRDEVARRSSPAEVIAAAGRIGMVQGGSDTFLNTNGAVPTNGTQDTPPKSLSPQTYDKTKPHLDPKS